MTSGILTASFRCHHAEMSPRCAEGSELNKMRHEGCDKALLQVKLECALTAMWLMLLCNSHGKSRVCESPIRLVNTDLGDMS
jgi:hypothetical protein